MGSYSKPVFLRFVWIPRWIFLLCLFLVLSSEPVPLWSSWLLSITVSYLTFTKYVIDLELPQTMLQVKLIPLGRVSEFAVLIDYCLPWAKPLSYWALAGVVISDLLKLTFHTWNLCPMTKKGWRKNQGISIFASVLWVGDWQRKKASNFLFILNRNLAFSTWSWRGWDILANWKRKRCRENCGSVT